MNSQGGPGQDSPASRRGAGLTLALVAATLGLSACKVVPIAADRAARERSAAAFDSAAYVAAIWDTQAMPYWTKAATPLAQLAPAIERDLPTAGADHGRRAGDGSPWTFVTEGQGVVTRVDTAARAGRVVVAASDPGGPTRPVEILIGPVVSGSTLRDSLPFVAFNDFSNQIAFAEVGAALTRRAADPARAVAGQLKVGDRVAFVGAFAVAGPRDPIVLTPVRLERAAGGG